MKPATLSITDRLGIAYGTVLFLLMLPVSIFVSALPGMVISNAISNKVLALTLNLAVMGIGAVVTLVMALVSGLALSYGLTWFARKLHLPQMVSEVAKNQKPLEASKRINIGAMVGLSAAILLFLSTGESPIASVTTRVEHLFPGPLVLSLGDLFSFDLSHTYAAATGFLSVGFLFAIFGIASGSLIFAAVERVALSRK